MNEIEKRTIKEGGSSLSPEWDNPFSYGPGKGGFMFVYRNGSKVAEIVSKKEDWKADAGFITSACNSRHNWLKKQQEKQ